MKSKQKTAKQLVWILSGYSDGMITFTGHQGAHIGIPRVYEHDRHPWQGTKSLGSFPYVKDFGRAIRHLPQAEGGRWPNPGARGVDAQFWLQEMGGQRGAAIGSPKPPTGSMTFSGEVEGPRPCPATSGIC
jgi:hypothetical protein